VCGTAGVLVFLEHRLEHGAVEVIGTTEGTGDVQCVQTRSTATSRASRKASITSSSVMAANRFMVSRLRSSAGLDSDEQATVTKPETRKVTDRGVKYSILKAKC